MTTDTGMSIGTATALSIEIQSWLLSVFTSKIFILNLVLSWAWIILSKKSIKPLIQKTEEHRKRDQKFTPFVRNDLQALASSWYFYLWMPTSFMRMIIAYGSIAVMCFFAYIFSFFKQSDHNFSGLSYTILRGFQKFSSYMNLLACGISRMETQYI